MRTSPPKPQYTYTLIEAPRKDAQRQLQDLIEQDYEIVSFQVVKTDEDLVWCYTMRAELKGDQNPEGTPPDGGLGGAGQILKFPANRTVDARVAA